ncbi:hypothetical protein V501_08659 [Pseudogymnoascus sp. VKM F-4519 (FW-2642)]|nr:hypothetical protein V501_08659 [Pseudogymnoascus sp. VKM F-4519 (FW-2642)]
MTSPHAASDEAVATMVTTAFDDSPTNIELTAADNAVPGANDIPATTAREDANPEYAEQVTTIEQLQISADNDNVEPNVESAAAQTQPIQIKSDLIMEPAIPRTPENNDDDTEYPRVPLGDYEQLRALSHMLQYQAPPGLAEALNASAMATLAGNDISMDNTNDLNGPYAEMSQPTRDNDETRISAYALLEFEDGQFYMNTYSVILGRDRQAARNAMRRDAEEAKANMDEHSIAGEPKTPVRIKREESKYTKSVISESGGILRDGDDSDSDERSRRRMHRKASKKSKSTGSSSNRVSRRQSSVQPSGKIEYQAQPQARRHAPETAGAVPVDPASLRPSPHDCPLVGIHPPATTPASGYKAISRRHVKIAYNSKKSLFEAEIIGRNGAFVDEVFYYHEDVIPLKSGSYLQIGGVVVRFVLPDVALGETGAEIPAEHGESGVQDRYVEGGKEMSFDFDDATREGALLGDSSDEVSDDADRPELGIEGEDDEEGDGDELGEQQEGSDIDEDNSELSEVPDEAEDGNDDQDEQSREAPESMPMPQKKRGPGRPPKNGIMSKREQQLAKKEAQQRAAQKTVSQPDTSGKNKVGRPRKNPVDESPVKTEKRKYTKRKPKDPDALVAKQEGSGEDDRPSKEKKEKKSTKPPRSPSPTFNEADLTPEQLAKPQANYVTLIHEALSNSPTGQMSLPQIYRAIQRRYPFFVLKCNTNGWQSSVRHNLSQHHAFRKVERDGKGWMWAIVDGVSIEKEKKRRPTPPHQLPPHLHQPIYRAGPHPHMMHGPPGMMPPPGYAMNHMPPHLRPGQPPQYAGQPMNGYPLPPGQHSMNGGAPPPGFPSALPTAQPMGATSNTYSSPYAPKPPANPTQQAPQNTSHNPSQAPQSVPYQTPQQPRPIEQGPPQPDNAMWRAIDSFRTNLVATMKPKNNKAEALVASSINRVMGVTSQSTATVVESDLKLEDQIMAALKSMLKRFPEFNNGTFQQPPAQLGTHTMQQSTQQTEAAPRQALAQLTPAPTGNAAHAASDVSVAKKAPTPGPAVQRPTFIGQSHNRPNGPSVPRPPMMTPGMTRANSSSSANPSFRATTSASPAPPPAASTTSASGDLPPHQVQNVPGTESNESHQKLLHQSAVNTESVGATAQPQPIAVAHQSSEITTQQPGSSNPTTNTNENGKRPLDEEDLAGGNEFKRLNASGPPALKT